ncbi:coiled-coil domain-containing protein 92 [Periophthalmus magnuspinnatus]|uniref:coiled-coil domain-containing protein 92 n=1 Tax=Periophthalmus magnuspinnatus TaxID=409849 RepID=UPI00145B1D03|nr:coiled-coil domain-containing protein 92 [Periophthalmus magnuspinnatus]XP_055082767.1 coiled-coil domain-containing protein 92 [Periophthalmus magnuspinnatus]
MATGRLEQQVASVERGIAFLKQEHRVMLTGLHVEITNLKRRCHELGCELDSRFPDRNPAEEEAELAARCEAVQHLLEDQHCMTLAARGKLRAGRARVSALGRSLREEERCFLEELKRRSHKITLMNRELQRQDSATSSLCRELHSARLKLFQQKQGEEGGGEETDETAKDQQDIEQEEDEEEDDDNDDYEDDSSDWLLSPPPPESPGQSELRVQRSRLSIREERVRACVPRERVTSPQRPLPMPDPALFLVPLRYRMLRLNRPIREQESDQLDDEWEDIDEGGIHSRVDMGAGEGETAL